MNPSKFSLADLLTVLASLSFGFVCFMGANFLNIGNDTVWGMSNTTGCIVMAVFCSGLMFGTAYGAKVLKRTSRNFKTSFVLEMILLFLFVFFAVFFATKTSPFTHYFTVTAKKSEIKSKLQTSIAQAENMFAEYESYAENRQNLFRSQLRSVVRAKSIDPNNYAACGFRNVGVSDERQIETKMFSHRADLFPSNYSDTIAKNGIKEVASEWLQNAEKITSNLKPIGIVGVVNDIEKNSKEWGNKLVTWSQVQHTCEGETIDFSYEPSFDNVKTYFTKLENPTPLSTGLAFLTYLLMLLSWFVTKRSTRFPGLQFLFGLGKSRDNEL